MRILAYTPGPPSRSDALIKQLADYLIENGHSVGYRYFGCYYVAENGQDVSREYEHADASITIGWNDNIHQIHKDRVKAGGVSIALSDGFIRRGWKEGSYFCLTRQGLHAYGDRIFRMPGDRWKKLDVKMMKWREDRPSNFILVAHQHTSAFDGTNRQPYFIETIKRLRELCPDREVILRPHPRDRKIDHLPSGALISKRPLADDLSHAHAVVTYDSNIAVESVLFGVPVFTRGKTMADPIANFDLDDIVDPPLPDRQQWAHDLAYAQWTVTELRAGLPWVHLVDGWLEGKASGLADQVDEPATENGDYEVLPEHLLDELTDWNCKPLQTPEDVAREILNPVHADKVRIRRSRFEGMTIERLIEEATKYGLSVRDRNNKRALVNRLIHATL